MVIEAHGVGLRTTYWLIAFSEGKLGVHWVVIGKVLFTFVEVFLRDLGVYLILVRIITR
jgi:hypothetical protein